MTCVKLEIGGGHRPRHGYINIDVRDIPTVDVVVSDWHLPMYADNSVDEVLSIHVLEHFVVDTAMLVLYEWLRILKPGGSLILCVPCLDRIVNNWGGRELRACEHTFGAIDQPGFDHKAFWTSDRLKEAVNLIGFSSVVEEPYEFPIHQKDWTIRLQCIK